MVLSELCIFISQFRYFGYNSIIMRQAVIFMKYHETDDYSFLLGNNHYIYGHKEDGNTLHLFIKSRPHSCKCPAFG